MSFLMKGVSLIHRLLPNASHCPCHNMGDWFMFVEWKKDWRNESSVQRYFCLRVAFFECIFIFHMTVFANCVIFPFSMACGVEMLPYAACFPSFDWGEKKKSKKNITWWLSTRINTSHIACTIHKQGSLEGQFRKNNIEVDVKFGLVWVRRMFLWS